MYNPYGFHVLQGNGADDPQYDWHKFTGSEMIVHSPGQIRSGQS